MPLVSSVVEDHAQRDGRRAVREAHTDDLGNVFAVEYLADADTDAAALLTLHAAQVVAGQEQAELQALIAYSLAGNDPRGFPFRWVDAPAAFGALMGFCLTADPATLLRFASIAVTYTADVLAATVGVEVEAAAAFIALAQTLVNADGALATAQATQAAIAAQLGA